MQFPPAYTNGKQTFPRLDGLSLTYAIHCCWYKNYVVHTATNAQFLENFTFEDYTNENISNYFPNLNQIQLNQSQIVCPNRPTNFTPTDEPFVCTPRDDPFHPCYDIIEFLWLRIAIWFIILISLCGNVLVFTVLLYGAVKKSMTVPQLMIMNLASADFCLGMYLLFIAAADLDTAGDYFNKAFEWERSAACKTAGFFAVLSSTASICVLGLITFERTTKIIFTFSGRDVMTLFRTVVCLIFVWITAFLFAVLPIFDINSYSRVAICLPIDIRDEADQVYISFLLFFTGAVCIFILTSYVILFIRVKKATSLTTRQEFKLALKMAILVVTDFLIWIPVAVFGLAGLFTQDAIVDVQVSRYLMIFLLPINSCINPVLYSLMQSSFCNQMCDVTAHFGLCQNYCKHRRHQQRGFSTTATSNPNSNRGHFVQFSDTLSNSGRILNGKNVPARQLQ